VAIVDSSALLAALTVEQRDPALAERLAAAPELHAPQIIDIEILHALRRLIATAHLDARRAQQVRDDYAALRLRRYPHYPLVDRIWELRDALTPSDAAFVALAEALDLPLVTCDPHLASSANEIARVELFNGVP
jgi:predicted nucleic acid-binding protein